jgi:hypothetical protein
MGYMNCPQHHPYKKWTRGDKLGQLKNQVFYLEIFGLYTSNFYSKLHNKNCAQLPILLEINP